MTWRIWIIIGSLLGLVSVALGAFGAHGLRERIDASAMQVFETGARYQMYHALALLAVGLLATRVDTLPLRIAGIAFTLGCLIFPGSLYTLALGGPRWLGAIAPVGGLAFMAGWLALAYAAFRPGMGG